MELSASTVRICIHHKEKGMSAMVANPIWAIQFVADAATAFQSKNILIVIIMGYIKEFSKLRKTLVEDAELGATVLNALIVKTYRLVDTESIAIVVESLKATKAFVQIVNNAGLTSNLYHVPTL